MPQIPENSVFVATASGPYKNFSFKARTADDAIVDVVFQAGMYTTEDQAVADALIKEANASGCEWLKVADCKIVSKEELDPLYELRRKIIAEEAARIQAAATTAITSANGKDVTMTTTKEVAGVRAVEASAEAVAALGTVPATPAAAAIAKAAATTATTTKK